MHQGCYRLTVKSANQPHYESKKLNANLNKFGQNSCGFSFFSTARKIFKGQIRNIVHENGLLVVLGMTA